MSDRSTYQILVIHGPNMNLVGKRPKETFGTLTLDKIDRELRRSARELDVTLKIFQSNSESEIITKLQRQRTWADGILLNPSTLCYTSLTLLDTLQLIQIPTVEIHLVDTLAGKSVSDSILKTSCLDQISGPVNAAYKEGLQVLLTHLKTR